MKKLITLLLMLAFAAGCACAEEVPALPQAVVDLCASVHPGYAIAAHDGWGNESCGQFALILKQGEDNILCMAEKAQDDSSYTLTIDNTNAVYDGDQLPSLLIDTGGDSLWYTYHDRENESSVHYGAVKSEGCWGQVSTLSYSPNENGISGMWSWVGDGKLWYEETDEDENENIRARWMYAPLEVSEEFAQSLELAKFDIDTFDADPTDGLYPLTKNEAFARSQAEDGDTLRDMDISRVHAARLFDSTKHFDAVGGRVCLRIDDWDGAFFKRVASIWFTGDAVMDTYHAGDGEVFIGSGVMMYSFNRVDEGSWVLTGVDDSGVRALGPDYIAPEGQTTVYRNDGYVYGSSPWGTLINQHMMLAPTYEEMYAQLDQNAYALVNNPNPADRLHLRAEPDKGAYSYGKFYNRTPVLVLERGDTWTKVQIGRGKNAITGYMMTQYLAFDESEKAQLACAFPQMQLREAYWERGALMLAAPNRNADSCGMFESNPNDFIIGVSGDDWYIVLRADGTVGYVPQHAFWDGNG
ncbi:MAG: SH3 domain-containing protein [Clostridiales bacterium]|nr:SH3 domain-containing protein [Clostridiales bacterium]